MTIQDAALTYRAWRLQRLVEGGAGSGHFGHKGRPGHRGGSSAGGALKPSFGGTPSGPSTVAAERWLAARFGGIQGVKPGSAKPIDGVATIGGVQYRMTSVNVSKAGWVSIRGESVKGKPYTRFDGKQAIRRDFVELKYKASALAPKTNPKTEARWQPAGQARVEAIFKENRVTITTVDGRLATPAQRKFVFETLGVLPEGHIQRSKTREVSVGGSVAAVNRVYQAGPGALPHITASGFYSRRDGHLVTSSRRDTLLHEWGHSMEAHAGRDMIDDVWYGGGKAGKISWYGKTNSSESWAEAYKLFATGKTLGSAPKAAAVMKEYFALKPKGSPVNRFGETEAEMKGRLVTGVIRRP